MRCIVTNKETNAVLRIGMLKEYWPNGYPIVTDADGHDTAYPTTFTALYEIEDIPAEVEAVKYCYTPELGFYENPNYEEPVSEKSVTEQAVIDSIIAEVCNE